MTDKHDDFEDDEARNTVPTAPIVADHGAELRELTSKLRQERQQHLDAVQKIDDTIADISSEWEDIRSQSDIPVSPKRQTVARYKPKATNAPKNKRGRKEGGGTAIIEKILRDNGGEMGSGELAEAAKDQGVKYPHSPFQSLKKRGRIKLEDHIVHLIEE